MVEGTGGDEQSWQLQWSHLLGKGVVPEQDTPSGAGLGQDEVPKKKLPPQLFASPLRQADEVGAKEEEEDDWLDIDRSSQLQNLLLHPFLD